MGQSATKLPGQVVEGAKAWRGAEKQYPGLTKAVGKDAVILGKDAVRQLRGKCHHRKMTNEQIAKDPTHCFHSHFQQTDRSAEVNRIKELCISDNAMCDHMRIHYCKDPKSANCMDYKTAIDELEQLACSQQPSSKECYQLKRFKYDMAGGSLLPPRSPPRLPRRRKKSRRSTRKTHRRSRQSRHTTRRSRSRGTRKRRTSKRRTSKRATRATRKRRTSKQRTSKRATRKRKASKRRRRSRSRSSDRRRRT